jgi:hypothetical protein
VINCQSKTTTCWAGGKAYYMKGGQGKKRYKRRTKENRHKG